MARAILVRSCPCGQPAGPVERGPRACWRLGDEGGTLSRQPDPGGVGLPREGFGRFFGWIRDFPGVRGVVRGGVGKRRIGVQRQRSGLAGGDASDARRGSG